MFEMCWAFSIYLEAVAILPQLFMLQKQVRIYVYIYIYMCVCVCVCVCI